MTNGLDHPKTHDIFQITESSCIAALVGQVHLTALLGAVCFLSLDTHQRPCSGADVNEIVVICRNCKNCRTGIMCSRCYNLYVKSNLCFYFLSEVSDACSRHDQLLEHFSRISKHIDQFVVPILCLRANQLSSSCLCVLAGLLACEEIVEIIRYVKHSLSLL